MAKKKNVDATPSSRMTKEHSVDATPSSRMAEERSVDATPSSRMAEKRSVDATPSSRMTKEHSVDATPSSRASEEHGGGAASTITYFDPRESVGHLRGGNLPHWRQDGVTYFVTFRTADSMPKERVEQWKAEREAWLKAHPQIVDATPSSRASEEHGGGAASTSRSEDERREYYRLFTERWQNWLDEAHGACLLARTDIAREVERCLRHDDGKRYRLDEFVIMPNHVHVLVTPLGEHTLSDILQAWKSVTGHAINKLANLKGSFWQKESFDHIVRSPEQLERIRAYIRDNPKTVDATPSSRASEEHSEGAASTSRRKERSGGAASTGWQHWEVPFDTDPD